jgi:hypothetical protein
MHFSISQVTFLVLSSSQLSGIMLSDSDIIQLAACVLYCAAFCSFCEQFYSEVTVTFLLALCVSLAIHLNSAIVSILESFTNFFSAAWLGMVFHKHKSVYKQMNR